MHYHAISTTIWFPLDDRTAVWPATEAISVMMEYCCSEAMIIVVWFWFLCASDEALMRQTCKWGSRHMAASAAVSRQPGRQWTAASVFSTNFILQDVSEIMCDFVLANEIHIVTTWPGNVCASGGRRLEERRCGT